MDNHEAVKEMFRIAKEKELEEQESNKTSEIKQMLNIFMKPQPKPASTSTSSNENGIKKIGVVPKVLIKAKKVKTEEESQGSGKVNLLETSKKAEPAAKGPALNLCSYSDDEE